MRSHLVAPMILLAAIAAMVLPIAAQESTNSTPPDLTPYFRAKVPQDYAPQGRPVLPLPPAPSVPIFPSVFIADTVVNNSDPNLTNTDHFGDTEPSIAMNPASCVEGTATLTLHGCLQIAILAFSGFWNGQGTFAPIWYSTNGGTVWTKEQTIPVPPNAGGTSGCPCDQDPDWGKNNELSATFLSVGPTNVYTATTTDPANPAAWNWFTSSGVAQRTNQHGVGNADQPWLLVNRDPEDPVQNDVYVDYDDFSGAPDMRVAVSYGLDPPQFTVDSLDGLSTGGINPGHRLAKDPRNGTMYSLYQRCVANCGGDPKTINYTLNRSQDGGMTWGLNGNPNGITAATGQSSQPTPKFGTVNALLGGVQHVSVDPQSGDVYVVYGNRDAMTGNNRMSVVRLTDDGMGGLTIGPSFFVTGQVQAALPSVAVARDARGSVGVLYDTFDGLDPATGLPTFSAHLSVSQNHGQTFQDVILETFLSPVPDNHNSRQRILGDYHQLKSAGVGFYGVFTANGVPFGRPFADTDPIFFKTFVGP